MKQRPMIYLEPLTQRRRLLQGLAGACMAGLGGSLGGCGGGGDDTAPPEADGRKLPLSGVDSGGTGSRVKGYYSAAFASIAPLRLNTTVFDTAIARVVDGDGNPVGMESLLPGMTGRIEADQVRTGASAATARALSIQVSEQLLGPVLAVDRLRAGFTVLTQQVAVTSLTVFGPELANGLLDVRGGMVLQVFGELDVTGQRIVATRVDLQPAAGSFVVRGVLSALDRARGLAAIGSLPLTFAADGAAQGTVLPADVAVGDVVRARLSAGSSDSTATVLSLRSDALTLPDRVEAEIQGRVTRVDSNRRFAVDGVEVDAGAIAANQGLTGLSVGARVEVHGRSSHGVLVADSVVVEPDEPVELEGRISAVDSRRQTFVLRGVTVSWSDATVISGGPARLLTERRRVAVVGRWRADRSCVQAGSLHLEA